MALGDFDWSRTTNRVDLQGQAQQQRHLHPQLPKIHTRLKRRSWPELLPPLLFCISDLFLVFLFAFCISSAG